MQITALIFYWPTILIEFVAVCSADTWSRSKTFCAPSRTLASPWCTASTSSAGASCSQTITCSTCVTTSSARICSTRRSSLHSSWAKTWRTNSDRTGWRCREGLLCTYTHTRTHHTQREYFFNQRSFLIQATVNICYDSPFYSCSPLSRNETYRIE